MNAPYPIVDQRNLAPVPPRKLFGAKRTRTFDEIPQGKANHRLVYRIDGDYLLDNAALPLDSPEVLSATHVSLVDVARDVEVVVQLDIPSKDADNFTLRVTFVCTVTDATALVREGSPEVASTLRAYLKGHHRLFELGLDYPLKEVNQARRKLNAQVKAFTTVNPPFFVGLTAELASTELLTPDEVATLEKTLREQERQYAIERRKQTDQFDLRDGETRYTHFDEARSQRHRFGLDAERRDYERDQYHKQLEAVAADAESALILALTNREITAKEFAEEITRREQEQLETSRAETARQREWEREDTRWEQEYSRLRWNAEREDRREELRHRAHQLDQGREDDRRREEWERADQNRKRELSAALITELVRRGFLDTANLNVEEVVNTVLDGQLEAERQEAPELPAAKGDRDDGTEGTERAAHGDDDVEMREEDAH